MKTKDFFLLSWKKVGLLVVIFFASVILHNLVSALIGIEEAFFFIIAVFIIPLYTLVAILFSLVNLVKKML